MALKDIVFVVLLWCLSSTLDVARGRILGELELEEELQSLNKPAVETIQTKYGDIYDCIDFYEQPAFDHPLLKDHKYNYKMPERKIKTDSSDLLHPKNIWLNGKGCPDGTVPIKRITKDDLIRAKQAAEIYDSKYRPQTADDPGVHYAVVRRNGNNINGGAMNTTLHNPNVQGKQFSGSHMSIRNGNESIEIGWIVYPDLYKDNQTRAFIFTKSQTERCFNTYCPGFIYFNTEVPLDNVFRYTRRGGQIYETKFFIYKDAINGDWFLTIRDNQVGSWPSRIFGSLSGTATYIEWGGETYSPPGVPSPPMGAGAPQFSQKFSDDAFCYMMELVDENHKIVLAEDLEVYVDAYPFYLVKNYGNYGGQFGNLASYGGAGGYTRQ